MPESVFPENEVEIFRDYTPDFLNDFQRNIAAVIHPSVDTTQIVNGVPMALPENQRAKEVNDARKQLLTFLKLAVAWENGLSGPPGASTVYEALKRRNFELARGRIKGLIPATNIPELTSDTLVTAQF